MKTLALPIADLIREPRLIRESGAASRIAAVLEPVLIDLGFRLVRVKLSGAYGNSLQIMAERGDGTLSIEDCESISRSISPILDLEDPIASAYRLEISSPGIDRPLVRRSDFERAIGHEAKIELSRTIGTRRRYRGEIAGFAERGGTSYLSLKMPDAASGQNPMAEIEARDIQEARLVLNDRLIWQASRLETAKGRRQER